MMQSVKNEKASWNLNVIREFYTVSERGEKQIFDLFKKCWERSADTVCLIKTAEILSHPSLPTTSEPCFFFFFTPQLCRTRAKLSVILSAALSRETQAHLLKLAADKIFMVSVCLFKQTHQGPKSPAAVTLWHVTSRAAETAVKASVWECFSSNRQLELFFGGRCRKPRAVNGNTWDWHASSTTILPLNVHPSWTLLWQYVRRWEGKKIILKG